jgi:hypothetical protein
MATAIEKQALENQQFLAQFNAQQQALRDADAARAQAERDQTKADNDMRFALLQAALTRVSAPTAQVEQVVEDAAAAPDAAALIAPIIENIQTNTAAMMEQVVRSLGDIQAINAMPRIARYIKDANGNNIGVESIVKGPQQ